MALHFSIGEKLSAHFYNSTIVYFKSDIFVDLVS